MTLPLAASYLEYLELRAFTDCLLAYQVGQALEFHGRDAVSVAAICKLPLASRWSDAQGNPVPMVSVWAEVERPEPGVEVVQFEARILNAIMDAGFPLALAIERLTEDGFLQRQIILDYRPQVQRPQLRVVEGRSC